MLNSQNLLQSGSDSLTNGDQIREYLVPVCTVKEEQKILEKYNNFRVAYILQDIYSDFYLMVELMKGYAERDKDGNEGEESVYYLLAEKLQYQVDKLKIVCSVIIDFHPVGKTTIGNANA